MYKILFVDTETTGLCDMRIPYDEQTLVSVWPYLTEISFQPCHYNEETGEIQRGHNYDFLIKPRYAQSLYDPTAQEVSGLTYEMLQECGVEIEEPLKKFQALLEKADFVVAYNSTFDMKMIKAEYLRIGSDLHMRLCPWVDPCYYSGSVNFNLTGVRKRLKQSELYFLLYNKVPETQHRANSDVSTLIDIFVKLKDHKICDGDHLKAIKNKFIPSTVAQESSS